MFVQLLKFLELNTERKRGGKGVKKLERERQMKGGKERRKERREKKRKKEKIKTKPKATNTKKEQRKDIP